MSAYSKVDPGTLGWVRSEIDETLSRARAALEQYVENPADATHLRFCITHLHQVVGTLLMVELDNAAALARETEALAEAILEGKVESRPEIFETLTRGILVLPDYLARLQYGQPDSPLRHAALLNDLRAARAAPPVSELDLFAPDLSVRPPPAERAGERLTDPAFVDSARQQRAAFQPLLLGWLRDTSRTQALRDGAAVLEKLQRQAGMPAVEQLFWASRGLLEALAGGFEATPERKKLLSRLDQLVKKLIDGADKAALRANAETLTRAMLWELARVPAADGLVGQLKRAFELDALLGNEPAAAADETGEMPAPEALQSVSAVLAKEIETAQDLLTAYFDPAQKGAATLDPLVEHLRRIGGTLDMLGLAPLKRLSDELVELARAILDGRVADSTAVSMPMAEALLLVERYGRELPRAGGDWERQADEAGARLRALRDGDAAAAEGIAVGEAALSAADYKQLLGVVAAEANVNLGKIEEAVEGFAKNPQQTAPLSDVPALLSQIQGAAQILGEECLAGLAERTRKHVQDVRDGALPADAAVLDGIAVCVGTIGAYLDGLKAGRRNLAALIDSAHREIDAAVAGKRRAASPAERTEALRAAIESWLTQPDAAARAAARRQIEAVRDAAAGPARERVRRIGEQMTHLLELVPDAATLTADVVTTLRQSLDALAGLVGAAPAVAAPVPKTAPLPKGLDAEILPIFIEDARDVLGNVVREVARLREDPDNREALAELRRGYHTLKGSGRMVGAADIAEHAWAIERILNRLRDGKGKPGEAIFDLLRRTQEALPQMIAQLENGTPPSVDVAALRAEAEALAAGQAAPPAAAGLPRIDPALLDIFTNEARGHLATVRDEVESCRASGLGFVSDALIRASHTLAGNARSLGLATMVEAGAGVEKLLHALKGKPAPLLSEHIELLDRYAVAVGQFVDALNGAGDPGRFARDFADIARSAGDAQARVESEESPLATEEITLETVPAPAPDAGSVEPPPEIPPTPPRIVAPAAPQAPEEAVDPDLLDVFREEAVDILAKVEEALTRWRARPDELKAVLELKRALHTLKGGARMAGALAMGSLAHGTETVLKHVEDRCLAPGAALFDLLDEIHDALVAMLDAHANRRTAPDVRDLAARVAALATTGDMQGSMSVARGRMPGATAPLTSAPAVTADDHRDAGGGATPGAVAEDVMRATDPGAETEAEPRQAWPEPMERRGQVRVSTGLLSNLVNYAGEVSIARARLEQQVYSFRDNLGELARNIARFRDQIRELEIRSESQILYRVDQPGTAAAGQEVDFDPLEFDRFTRLQQLSRQLAESLHDLTTIQGNLGNFVGEAQTALLQQARINTELQEGLMRTRMVRFDTLAGRLRHIVRTTARELGKRAELDLAGAAAELDRTVLERVVGPFEHMIRNAIDHGLEPEAERVRAGKPATGRITVATAQEGSEVVIRFGDDGRGLDLGAIRAKAVERGMMPRDAALTEEELIQFILAPGFSTARAVTHFSGRGVGMDAVHNEVKQLGGSMSVDTQPGAGTTFVIRLPLTLSLAQALMVQAGDQLFAVPLAAVTNIVEYPVERLNAIAASDNPLLDYRDRAYPYMHLGRRLGLPAAPPAGDRAPILLARTGTREVALQVDGLRGTREVVVKALDPQLAEVKGLGGATVLGDGRVVLILDVAGLWYRDDAIRIEPAAGPGTNAEAARARPVVMIVDDSLTVRKVTGKHLQRRGLDVMVAKDGVDAVEQLRERLPDLMLVDIEMPRMDGYELTARVRGDARLRRIPIVVITSRAGAKHRDKAFELGADLYMSKPYQEAELFENIDRLLANGRSN